jgi:choloylglycine hydrolase
MKRIRAYASWLLLTLLAIAILPIFAANPAIACTGIDFSIPNYNLLGAKYVFSGRTMEFGPDVLNWKLLYVPRNYEYQSCKIDNVIDTCGNHRLEMIKGYRWPVKYAYVGFTPMRPIKNKLEYTLTEINDGINEAGLYCGGFYHMGWEEYSKVKPFKGQKNISDSDFPSWVLGQFASVAELRSKLTNDEDNDPVQVRQVSVEWAPGIPVAKEFPQLHFKVVDKTGAAIVIEFVNGKAKIFDSVGVITNNPNYDWQLTNLRNYVGLQCKNHENVQLMKATYDKLSNGTGAIGLPGDFTTTSRFIRAMFLLNATLANNTIQSTEEAILRAFRILNQFDIPEGSVVETKPDNPDKVTTMEATCWTSMADLVNLRYYYHTMNSRTIRMIELGELLKRLPDAHNPITIEMPANELILNVTDKFQEK